LLLINRVVVESMIIAADPSGYLSGSAMSYLTNSSHVIFETSTVTCAEAIEFAARKTIAEIARVGLFMVELPF
jgi:hypothetical protein